jgi:hypothetical protein
MAIRSIGFIGSLQFSGQVEVDPGGGAPEWVPEGFSIWVEPRTIDGHPTGRAWVDGVGEVAVDTLLGGDPNTEGFWGESAYDPSHLSAEGYSDAGATNPPGSVAAIGALRDALISGSTFVLTMHFPDSYGPSIFLFMSASGNSAIECDIGISEVSIYSMGSFSIPGISEDEVVGLNKVAATITPTRAEVSFNGSEAQGGALTTADWPTSGEDEIVAVAFDIAAMHDGTPRLYSLGVRAETLPDMTGLPTLSAI